MRIIDPALPATSDLQDFDSGTFVKLITHDRLELGPFIVCMNLHPFRVEVGGLGVPAPMPQPGGPLVGDVGWGTKNVVLVNPENGHLFYANGKTSAFHVANAAIVLDYMEGG